MVLAALATLAGFAALAGCEPDHPFDSLLVREITPSFLAGGRDAAVAADAHGRVALTWVRRTTTGKDLWLAVSRDSGVTFGPPVRVNPRQGSVVSFFEGRPMPVFGPSGELAVTWAERRPDTSGGVDVALRSSGDAGVTLGPMVFVNDDATSGAAYHGFPALTFLADGALFAAWLDERENHGAEGEPAFSALYSATSRDGGQSWSANLRLADSVCACCRPVALADTGGRIAVAYRDGAWDLRDPALGVWVEGGRTRELETVISPDRWLLPGCPDQGPGLTWNRAGGGHYAWFTGAGAPAVHLVPWRHDQGASGVKRTLSDSLAVAQHPKLATLGAGTLISVEARPASDTTRTVLAVRTLDASGSLGPWTFLGADASAGWIVGIDSRTALACWTEGESGVRLVRLRRGSPADR